MIERKSERFLDNLFTNIAISTSYITESSKKTD